MDQTTTYVLLAAVIAGITELLTRLRAQDYWSAVTIACAAVTGLVFGLFGVEGLTAVTGLAAGFGASGALTGISFVGQRTASTARDAIRKS